MIKPDNLRYWVFCLTHLVKKYTFYSFIYTPLKNDFNFLGGCPISEKKCTLRTLRTF